MVEKVNPAHPDKLADRIAGALVDEAYRISEDGNPRIAVEVLLGHGNCYIISEASVNLSEGFVWASVRRITGSPTIQVSLLQVPQDCWLSMNQAGKIRCGDNGIFRGMPFTEEQKNISQMAKTIYEAHKTDGKYILNGKRRIICQSLGQEWLEQLYPDAEINPLGSWCGGIDVDSGATNRKLGSDMFDAVTGGGLHGKDLSKADVSCNIYAHLMAQMTEKPYEMCCAIGDETVNGLPYGEIVEVARKYINDLGGFEQFAMWGFMPR